MLKYILLGIFQGFTEFLPVSSSGHLVIMQRMLGLSGQEMAVSLVLHLGTLLAIILFFIREITKLCRSLKTVSLIIIVTAITGTIGILGKDFFETIFSSLRLVSFALLINGLILLFTKKFRDTKRESLGTRDAVVLGFTQSLAILPGISRSGITISTLLFRGISQKLSFEFSFLASLPLIAGANLLEAREIVFVFKSGALNLTLGFFSSLLAGLVALRILKALLVKARLYYFGYYCIALGLVTLVFLK